MLDRLQVLAQIQSVSSELFHDNSALVAQAKTLWKLMVNDLQFADVAQRVAKREQLPEWHGRLDDVHPVAQQEAPYTVLAVDGSQIYPDRHYGVACYLLNFGTVVLQYGVTDATVDFSSQPMLCIPNEQDLAEDGLSIDVINCRRHEFELRMTYEKALALQKKSSSNTTPLVLLLDGSYIAWHLQAKDVALQKKFLPYQLDLYEKMYQAKMLVAGYISMPRSKELVNLLTYYHAECTDQGLPFSPEQLLDTTVARFFLQPFTHTTVFKNNAPISWLYPEHLRPWFCYVDVEDEIVRVEIPQWIAHDNYALQKVIAVAVDQSNKGGGYPVCLAEAHEQAVVKGPDRDFFYQCIERIAIEHGHNLFASQKSVKKRGIAV